MVKVLVCEAENARSIRAIYQKREYSLGGVEYWLVEPGTWVQLSLLSNKPTWRNGIRGGLKILFLSVQVRWWVFLGRRQVVRQWLLKPPCAGSNPAVLINQANKGEYSLIGKIYALHAWEMSSILITSNL